MAKFYMMNLELISFNKTVEKIYQLKKQNIVV